MSWRASAYIKALVVCPNGKRISGTEKLVALVLADSHQDKGEGTYPAVRTIAEDALVVSAAIGQANRQYDAALAALAAATGRE